MGNNRVECQPIKNVDEGIKSAERHSTDMAQIQSANCINGST